MQPLLRVSGLAVDYTAAHGEIIHALRGVDLEMREGETLCISGASGCGKSTLALAILRLLPGNAAVISGTIKYGGLDLLATPLPELRKIRGRKISLISQEPALALNPVLTAGTQIAEVLRAHAESHDVPGKARLAHAAHEILRAAGLEEPERIAQAYPHQLSGGQRQRVALAQALVCRPSLLIADEPFSSLDAITQAGLLDLLQRLKEELGLAILLITHHEGLLSFADRKAVMREGRMAPCGGLPDPQPGRDAYEALAVDESTLVPEIPPRPACEGKVLLEIRGLRKKFAQRRLLARKKFIVQALDGIDLTLCHRDTIAIGGRSGSGKSTLARCIAGLETPDEGEVLLEGAPVRELPRISRRQIQMIFQDAPTSLNPGFTAGQLVAEPLEIMCWGSEPARRRRAADLMREVGLDPRWGSRPAGEFSGGQRQRLAIARALAASPKLLILDEALAGLDPPLQAQMARLLLELQSRHALTFLYISHDLNFVSWFAREVLIMSQGKIVDRLVPGSAPGEFLPKDLPEDFSPEKFHHETFHPEIFHPETRALLEASRRLHTPGMGVAG